MLSRLDCLGNVNSLEFIRLLGTLDLVLRVSSAEATFKAHEGQQSTIAAQPRH